MSRDLDKLAADLQAKVDADALDRFGPRVVERWRRPRRLGALPLASAMGAHRDAAGRSMTVYLEIAQGRIARAGYEGQGCGTFMVCCDVAAELAEGLTPAQAATLDAQRILDALEGLPRDKQDYAETAAAAVRAAAEDALRKGR